MTLVLRAFLFFEAATFMVAALIHRGFLVQGYEHAQAHVAESIIAAVLFGGLLLTFFVRPWTRKVSLIVQGFALVGTLVGIFTIIMGVGPRTVPDVVYHLVIAAVLICGFLTARRAPAAEVRWQG